MDPLDTLWRMPDIGGTSTDVLDWEPVDDGPQGRQSAGLRGAPAQTVPPAATEPGGALNTPQGPPPPANTENAAVGGPAPAAPLPPLPPNSGQIMASESWKKADPEFRSHAVNQWAIQSKTARDWTPEQTATLNSSIDAFHEDAGKTWWESSKGFASEAAGSALRSIGVLPATIPKVIHDYAGFLYTAIEGKLKQLPPDEAMARLEELYPDAAAGLTNFVRIGEWLRQRDPLAINAVKDFAAGHPRRNAKDQFENVIGALRTQVLEDGLPEDPDELFDYLHEISRTLAIRSAIAHGDNPENYLTPLMRDQLQPEESQRRRELFKAALRGEAPEDWQEAFDSKSPSDEEIFTSADWRNQSRSLVESPQNLGLLIEAALTRDPDAWTALRIRLDRSQLMQHTANVLTRIDENRGDPDIYERAVRFVYRPVGLDETMAQELRGMTQSPIDSLATVIGLGAGMKAVKAARAGRGYEAARQVGKATLVGGAQEFGASAAYDDVPNFGNQLYNTAIGAGAGAGTAGVGAGIQLGRDVIRGRTTPPEDPAADPTDPTAAPPDAPPNPGMPGEPAAPPAAGAPATSNQPPATTPEGDAPFTYTPPPTPDPSRTMGGIAEDGGRTPVTPEQTTPDGTPPVDQQQQQQTPPAQQQTPPAEGQTAWDAASRVEKVADGHYRVRTRSGFTEVKLPASQDAIARQQAARLASGATPDPAPASKPATSNPPPATYSGHTTSQQRMAERTLVRAGVSEAVARQMGPRVLARIDPATDAETLRDTTLKTFQELGGILPGQDGNATYTENIDSYIGAGHSRADAQKLVDNAKAANAQRARDVNNANTRLARDLAQRDKVAAEGGRAMFSQPNVARQGVPKSVMSEVDPAEVKSRTVAGQKVGTRSPTAKAATETGTDPANQVDLKVTREREPKVYVQNAAHIVKFPLVARLLPALARAVRKLERPMHKAEADHKVTQAKQRFATDAVKKAIGKHLGIPASKVKVKTLDEYLANENPPKGTKQKLAALIKARAENKAMGDRKTAINKQVGRARNAWAVENISLEQADQIYQGLTQMTEDNLLALMELMQPHLKDLAKLWYDGANIIAQNFAKEFGVTLEQAAAVLAVFSPQKDWFMNVALAKRAMEVWQTQQDTAWSPEMTAQYLKRMGEPQITGEKVDGSPIYEGNAKPQFDVDGNIIGWTGWSDKQSAEATARAQKDIKKAQGLKLKDLPEALQYRFIRIWSEVNHDARFDVVTPDGRFADKAKSEKTGKELRLAWGSYSTIEKAVEIMQAPTEGRADIISKALGDQHKVRSFYDNITDPQSMDGEVTMDTHAIAALLWLPLSGQSLEVTQNFGGGGVTNSSITGMKGLYAAFAEAYRSAARRLGNFLPREIQSVTWEAVRLLFTAEFKRNPTKVKQVREVWNEYERGTITATEARRDVFRIAKGYDLGRAIETGYGVGPTTWAEGAGISEQVLLARGTNDSGKLPARRATGRGRRDSGAGPGTAGGIRRAGVVAQASERGGLEFSQPVFVGQKIKNPLRTVKAAIDILAQRWPGINSGRVSVFQNAAAFLASKYTRTTPFTQAEMDGMQTAEGFFDPLTGRTVLFADQIEIRPGESAGSAIARVVIHERIGHEGIHALMQADPQFKAKVDALIQQIPDAALNEIAAEPAYAHIAGDRAALAFEWLARQAEVIEGAGIQGGLKGVAAQLWQALQTAISRLFRDYSRRAATRAEVAEILMLSRGAVMAGDALPTGIPGAAVQMALAYAQPRSNRTGPTRIFHRPHGPFRVRNLTWRAIISGSPLPSAFVDASQATQREAAALNQRGTQIGRDLHRQVQALLKADPTLTEADVYMAVADAMDGLPGAFTRLEAINPQLAETTRSARNFIDQLSDAIAQTLPNGDLRNTIVGNLGNWLRRSYATFDPNSGWNYDNLEAAARKGEQHAGKDARQIMRDAIKLMVQNDPTRAADVDPLGLAAPDSALEADIRQLLDRDAIGSHLTGGGKVRKNVSSLLHRKTIDPAIRELLGEQKNPVARFAQSAQFAAQFLTRHQQQVTMAQIGLDQNLFSTDQRGTFTVQIPNDHAWSGMAGLWTTPELFAALQSSQVKGDLIAGKLGETLKAMSAFGKLNRVANNPDSWMVNLMGNPAALLMSGDLFYPSFFKRFKEATRIQMAGRPKRADIDAAASALTDAYRGMAAKLTAAGVLGQTVSFQDLQASLPKHLLGFIEQNTGWNRVTGAMRGGYELGAMAGGFGVAGRVVGGVVGGAIGAVAGFSRMHQINMKLAHILMTTPDAQAKIIGYLRNYDQALKAGLTPEAANQRATERTRNTFPDYSKIPTPVRELSRYGLINSFVAFQYEVYRNTAWNIRYMVQDLKSGNKAQVLDGLVRLGGISAITYLTATGLQAFLSELAGDDTDEKDKAYRRWFAAPWERFSALAFNGYNDDGVAYFNTGYLLPTMTLKELYIAAKSGEDPAEIAGNLVASAWQQFGEGSVNLEPVLQAISGRNSFDDKISNRTGAGQVIDRLDHVAKTTFTPGWAEKLQRITYAMREAERRNRTFSLREEALRFVGVRQVTRTWPNLVQRGYRNLGDEYSRIRARANDVLGENLPGAQRKAIEVANRDIEALIERRDRYEQDLRVMRIPERTINGARRDSSIPRRFNLLQVDPRTRTGPGSSTRVSPRRGGTVVDWVP